MGWRLLKYENINQTRGFLLMRERWFSVNFNPHTRLPTLSPGPDPDRLEDSRANLVFAKLH